MPKEIADPLSADERKEWTKIKGELIDGASKWVEYGAKLMRARDARLYREDHETFEHFIERDLGWHRSRAYQLIEACEVRQDLSTSGRHFEILPENERQLRELAKAPDDKTAEVWEAVIERAEEKGIEPTAKLIKDVRQEICGDDPKPNGKPKPTPPEREPGDDADEPTFAEQITASHATILEISKAIARALTMLTEVKEQPGTEAIVSKEKSIRNYLEDAKGIVMLAMPHEVCPRCDGKGCPQCGNYGWVNLTTSKGLRA